MPGSSTQFTFNGNNLSKLFLSAPITGGAAVPLLLVSKNGNASNACSVQASPLAVNCSFGQTKGGDRVHRPARRHARRRCRAVTDDARLDVLRRRDRRQQQPWRPLDPGLAHGSRQREPGPLGRLRQPDPFDQARLRQQQAVREAVEPARRQVRQVNDNAGANGDFPIIELTVNNGAQPTSSSWSPTKGTKAPTYFEHTSTGYLTTVLRLREQRAEAQLLRLVEATTTVTLYLAPQRDPPPQRLVPGQRSGGREVGEELVHQHHRRPIALQLVQSQGLPQGGP